MQKESPFAASACHEDDVLLGRNATSGDPRETDANEPTAILIGEPAWSSAVNTTTPVGCPSTSRKLGDSMAPTDSAGVVIVGARDGIAVLIV